jgi:hypothetical protein
MKKTEDPSAWRALSWFVLILNLVIVWYVVQRKDLDAFGYRQNAMFVLLVNTGYWAYCWGRKEREPDYSEMGGLSILFLIGVLFPAGIVLIDDEPRVPVSAFTPIAVLLNSVSIATSLWRHRRRPIASSVREGMSNWRDEDVA